jgi:hypothetical protein
VQQRATHDTVSPVSWRPGEGIAMSVVEEGGRRDLFLGKAQR